MNKHLKYFSMYSYLNTFIFKKVFVIPQEYLTPCLDGTNTEWLWI